MGGHSGTVSDRLNQFSYINKILELVFLLSLLSSTSDAQTTTTVRKKLDQAIPSKSTSQKFHLTVELETLSSLHEFGSVDHKAQTELTLRPSYDLNANYTVIAETGVLQKFTSSQKTSMPNSKIGLEHSPFLLPLKMELQPAATVTLPTNEDDRIRDSYNGGAHLSLSLSRTGKWGAQALTLAYSVAATQNIHTYTRNNADEPNIERSLLQIPALVWGAGKNFELTVYYTYQMGWTYTQRLSSQFILGEQLTFKASPAFELALGHKNGGDALQGNGRDSNIRWYNENSSSIYFSMIGIY